MLKSVVIGLDGATWDVIGPLIEGGHMPSLAEVVRDGVRGPLRSTLPAITGTAWPTFMTGKGPGRHGCYDWGVLDADYKLSFVNFARVTDLTFWDVLNLQGETVGVLNMPFTYPPRELDGFLVTGLGTPDLEHAWTQPSWLGQRILSRFGKYLLDEVHSRQRTLPLEQLVGVLSEQDSFRTDVLLWLLDEFAPDHLVTVYSGPDRLQHIAFDRLAGLSAGQPVPEAIIRYFEALDGQIGRVLARTGETTNVVVVSDHGFTVLDKTFYINDWLRERGWLVTLPLLERLAYRLRGRLGRIVREGRSRSGVHFDSSRSFDATSMLGDLIDWRRTRAFSNSHNQ